MAILVKSSVEKLLIGTYSGILNVNKLPKDLYSKTAKKLVSGVNKGFGKAKTNASKKTLKELKNNIYVFSGAKTYQQVRTLSDMAEKSKTFSEFKKKATPILKLYNEDWLRTEYNTAVGQSQCAAKWQEFEENKEDFPLIEYSAVLDSKTSNICAPLNKVTLPIGDPFWNTHAPLNHFNCRCLLKQISKYENRRATSERKVRFKTALLEGEIKPMFQMNPGKDRVVFKEKGKGKHPYFEVAPKDKKMAERNFNLPIPKKNGKKSLGFR